MFTFIDDTLGFLEQEGVDMNMNMSSLMFFIFSVSLSESSLSESFHLVVSRGYKPLEP